MKTVKIITISEINEFVIFFQKNIIDVKKTNLLKTMKIASIYDISKMRGKDCFTEKISNKIINFAKNYGFEFM